MVIGGVGLWLAVAGAPLAAGDDSAPPHRWLERMRIAAAGLNYEGVFVYRRGGHMETIRIIHRVSDGQEQERLTSLNGAPREVVRDQHGLTCIRGDERAVLVDESRGRGLLGSRLREFDDRLLQHYRVSLGGNERIAGRPTREVRIEPADEFRYGLRLWLDEQTGLLLKSAVVGAEREPVEELIFTSIDLPDSIPENALKPELSGEGFERRTITGAPGASEDLEASPWTFGWLPPGFDKSAHSRDTLAGSAAPVEHIVFTDGLAAFSVYLEEVAADQVRLEGATRVGGLSAFGRRVGANHQVTVLGEVPSETVGRVARAMQRR